MDRRLRDLTRANLDDLARSFGVARLKPVARLLGLLFRSPAERFARQVLAMDRAVLEHGRSGYRDLVQAYTDGITVEGLEHLPAAGPLLLVSNHPGMADTPLLLATITRDDLRVVAEDRPFLRSIASVQDQLITIAEDRRNLPTVMRHLIEHLRAGGAVLTFPAGDIEPDPLSMPGALASLARWSRSIGVAARLVPRLRILPVLVAGVIAAESLRHPLRLLRRRALDREHLAASLQLLYRLYRPRRWPVHVRLRFFPPLASEAATASIIAAVRSLYRSCIAEWGGIAS